MQVLFGAGEEHGQRTCARAAAAGPGSSSGSTAPVLPHMELELGPADRGNLAQLLAGLGGEQMFYFVHSYAVLQAPPPGPPGPPGLPGPGATEAAPLVTWATHGEPFVAAVEDGPLAATQFHPEKSGDAGAVLLANWLETLR